MDTVKPSELRTAARVADALVYAAGLAGIVAGALLFSSGQLPFAIVAWVLSFVAGAVLRLVAWATRALADLLVQGERIERALDDLRVDHSAPQSTGRIPDPYRRWGGFH
jgi:hypothetical protein